jgi:hypothetical protein
MKYTIDEIKKMQLLAGLINEVEYNESLWGVNKQPLNEAKEAKETKKEVTIDTVNPYEYRHGLQHELNELGEYTDEALEKAKATVLKNLAKDANFYSSLLNQDQSSYEFKAPETDKPGYQARPDGNLKKELKKDEKANVKDNLGKKEEGTTKPKGVKVMPDKGVTGSEKTIKENLINEVILKVYHYDPSSGNLEDVDVEYFGSEDEAKKSALAHHWQIAFDNGDTELSKDEFVAQTDFNDLQPYDNYDYVIAPDKGNIKEGLEEAKNKKYVVFDKARGEKASKAFDTKEEAEAELKKINAEDPEHGDYVIDVNENIEEIKKKVINKYINIEIEDDGEEFPVLNKKSISDYLKSVIDPSEIKAVNSFMRDEEGFDESASYLFEDIGDTEISDTTEQEVEDWAKQEMSYYLFSEPDEFPSKELEEEFRPGVDLGASFSKFKGMTDAEDQFEDLMRDYDWYYEMSDDPRIYSRGQEVDQKLKSLVKTVGNDRAVELFNQYAPSDRKVTTSFFMEAKEDKHAKIKEALKAALKKTTEGKTEDELAKKSAIQTEKAKLLALNKQKQELQADATKTPQVKDSERKQIDLKIKAANDQLNKLNQGKITVV